ncbi:MAG: ATP-binding protein, partial [Desulfobacterales bacterium]|nr:ATP-binding protein [Desulfobacterales bacterium]
VTDTGIGIPRDRIDDIFKPFFQAEPAITRQYGGTGLGIAISRTLAEKMGGSIQVASRKKGGSRFTVRLPLEEVASAPERFHVPDHGTDRLDDGGGARDVISAASRKAARQTGRDDAALKTRQWQKLERHVSVMDDRLVRGRIDEDDVAKFLYLLAPLADPLLTRKLLSHIEAFDLDPAREELASVMDEIRKTHSFDGDPA